MAEELHINDDRFVPPNNMKLVKHDCDLQDLDEDKELWLINIPTTFDSKHLNGKTFDFEKESKFSISFECTDDIVYSCTSNEIPEMKKLTCVVPSANKKRFIPSRLPITGQINVTEVFEVPLPVLTRKKANSRVNMESLKQRFIPFGAEVSIKSPVKKSAKKNKKRKQDGINEENGQIAKKKRAKRASDEVESENNDSVVKSPRKVDQKESKSFRLWNENNQKLLTVSHDKEASYTKSPQLNQSPSKKKRSKFTEERAREINFSNVNGDNVRKTPKKRKRAEGDDEISVVITPKKKKTMHSGDSEEVKNVKHVSMKSPEKNLNQSEFYFNALISIKKEQDECTLKEMNMQSVATKESQELKKPKKEESSKSKPTEDSKSKKHKDKKNKSSRKHKDKDKSSKKHKDKMGKSPTKLKNKTKSSKKLKDV